MNSDMLTGLLLVLVAGLFQGSFVLPMTLTRRWQWEHNWMAFSVFGMVIFNWLIASQVIPNLSGAIRATPTQDVLVLLLFGGLWGLGAVLFGLGMDKLGMALGYPIIMGLIRMALKLDLKLFCPATCDGEDLAPWQRAPAGIGAAFL